MNNKQPHQFVLEYNSASQQRKHSYAYIIGATILAAIIVIFIFWPRTQHTQATNTAPLDVPQATISKTKSTPSNEEQSWTTYTIRPGDNLSNIFKRHKLSKQTLAQIMELGKIVKPLHQLRPGHQLHIQYDQHSHLQQLIANLNMDKNLVIQKTDEGFDAYIEHVPLESREKYSTATIEHSLFSAGTRAGMPSKLIYELINNFAWDIDFAKDIRPGDQLSVLYDDYYHGDKKVASGHILAAAFSNQGNLYTIFRYTLPSGRTGYYTLDGHSVKQRFLRAPVEYTRISSRFVARRKHPILHRIRAHRGTDYAAPHGTPIHSTAIGTVIFRGRRGGYGNAVIINHGSHYTTLYGHMSRFAKKVRKGTRVKQGQVIGYVGSTGLATGNHVHYEFRIRGKHYDPLKVTLPKTAPIPKRYRKEFLALASKRFTALHLYQNAQLAQHSN